jgi:REP element-mobilizing transposase RayT
LGVKIIYKNRLPHIAPIGSTLFVTFRQANSIPLKIIKQYQEEYNSNIRKYHNIKFREFQKIKRELLFQLFLKYDSFLHKNTLQNSDLHIPEIANIIKTKLHSLDKEVYNLIAYCIMPNHVHLLIDLSIQVYDDYGNEIEKFEDHYIQLDKIMKSIKGSTARAANHSLGRKGTFWQKDSYDHYIRNNEEFWNIINYILNNPVKAGMVSQWENYPNSFLNEDMLYI